MKLFSNLILVAALGGHVFFYNDRVRVTEGFYTGCIGLVEDERPNDVYEVVLIKCGKEELNKYVFLKAYSLELLKKR